jgi:hypothetical protein
MHVRWWKVVGLAAFAGVAATGVVIARAERRRRAYTPEEVRARLRARHAEVHDRQVGDAGRQLAGGSFQAGALGEPG